MRLIRVFKRRNPSGYGWSTTLMINPRPEVAKDMIERLGTAGLLIYRARLGFLFITYGSGSQHCVESLVSHLDKSGNYPQLATLLRQHLKI